MSVLAFGELLLRLSPPGHLRIEQAHSFDARYGGAEANVAVSLALQGDAAAYVTVVPDNRIGDCAVRSIAQWGVDMSRVMRGGDRLGTYYMEFGASVRSNAVVYDRKYSAVSMANPAAYDWDALLDGVDTFYVSGVTPALSDGCARAVRDALGACRAKGITTVCDLNYRGKLWTPDQAQRVMCSLMPLVDVCVANDEDAPSALGVSCVTGSLARGIDERDSYVLMANDIYEQYGCHTVASVIRNVSSVEKSSWMGMLYTNDQAWFSAVHDVHVLEGVAAGDAFCAGLLHALVHDMPPQEAIDYAIAASVLKLTVHGDANLVTADEIAAVAAHGAGTRVAR